MTDIETFCQSTSVNQTERSSKSTDQTQVKELLDFSLNIIPGLYRCTADEMFFEIIEGNTISRAYLSFNNPTLSYKIISSSTYFILDSQLSLLSFFSIPE